MTSTLVSAKEHFDELKRDIERAEKEYIDATEEHAKAENKLQTKTAEIAMKFGPVCSPLKERASVAREMLTKALDNPTQSLSSIADLSSRAGDLFASAVAVEAEYALELQRVKSMYCPMLEAMGAMRDVKKTHLADVRAVYHNFSFRYGEAIVSNNASDGTMPNLMIKQK